MSKLGVCINIDDQLSRIERGSLRNRIYRVGVELEGGWNEKKFRIIRDGSVTLDVPCDQVGELPSKPLEPRSVAAWMEKFYPDVVNHTCGLHVHLSFRSALTYQRLMTPDYPATILSYITDWSKEKKLAKDHPIWDRLEGNSLYCQHRFMADEQAVSTRKDYDQRRPGHRYTIVNYSYSVHSTLECRLLPMMATADLGISAVTKVMDITNAFLVATAKKEAKIKNEFVVEDDSVVETHNIVI